MGLNWIRQACEGVSRGLPWRGQLQGVSGCGRPRLTLADRTLEELVSKDRQEVGRGKEAGVFCMGAHKVRAPGGEGLGWQDQREIQGMWGTAWTLQRLDPQPGFPRQYE